MTIIALEGVLRELIGEGSYDEESVNALPASCYVSLEAKCTFSAPQVHPATAPNASHARVSPVAIFSAGSEISADNKYCLHEHCKSEPTTLRARRKKSWFMACKTNLHVVVVSIDGRGSVQSLTKTAPDCLFDVLHFRLVSGDGNAETFVSISVSLIGAMQEEKGLKVDDVELGHK
ncbi:hypothetical protein SISNIDRAFT_471469 [Sistotremastrum niveocremeum HHB9708]|uniref:Uncharacterized protein n=1 Tax=Sistotremastrum niveocremeum HHB9708 TaxID=1314777 RepID=A0A164MLQ2_9AGAM|nr:hypothetical protein SISNIDRAFT_471469 [Sistotremastrum niveocremeum HHB9708]